MIMRIAWMSLRSVEEEKEGSIAGAYIVGRVSRTRVHEKRANNTVQITVNCKELARDRTTVICKKQVREQKAESKLERA